MAKHYPALDIRPPQDADDVVYALLDDFGPTAIEERLETTRVFFGDPDTRDRALTALPRELAAVAVDVPDEDWARRSQEHLAPVTVARLTISPRAGAGPLDLGADPSVDPIVIQPSMGFGTGHHASTRLCLAALQTIDLTDKTMLDVGTGSGVLAIAAARLGARRAHGIDVDADAIEAARSNVALNRGAEAVSLAVADVAAARLGTADVVAANLTGAALVRLAPLLMETTGANGSLVLSGILRGERDEVVRAFSSGHVVWEREEDEWVGLVVKKS